MESRRQHRIVYQTKIRMRAPGREESVVARVQNLSSRGMFVTASDLPDTGTEVQCRLTLGGERRTIKGRVAWVRPASPSSPLKSPGAGIEFIELDKRDSDLLTRLVEPGDEKQQPVDVWFEGMTAPIRCQAVVIGEGLRLETRLPFMRLHSEVKVAFTAPASANPDLVTSARPVPLVREGVLDGVTLEPSPDDGVPFLRIGVTMPPLDSAQGTIEAGGKTLPKELTPIASTVVDPAVAQPYAARATLGTLHTPKLTAADATPVITLADAEAAEGRTAAGADQAGAHPTGGSGDLAANRPGASPSAVDRAGAGNDIAGPPTAHPSEARPSSAPASAAAPVRAESGLRSLVLGLVLGAGVAGAAAWAAWPRATPFAEFAAAAIGRAPRPADPSGATGTGEAAPPGGLAGAGPAAGGPAVDRAATGAAAPAGTETGTETAPGGAGLGVGTTAPGAGISGEGTGTSGATAMGAEAPSPAAGSPGGAGTTDLPAKPSANPAPSPALAVAAATPGPEIEPIASPPAAAPDDGISFAKDEGRLVVSLPLEGNAAGAKEVRYTDPPGVGLALPRSRPKAPFGIVRPGDGPVRVLTRKRQGGSLVRFLYDTKAYQGKLAIEPELVRLTLTPR